jgi:drug/metabolite transporter (DMT)-like permease
VTAAFVPLAAPFPLAGEAAALSAALIWSGSMSLYARHAHGLPAETVNLFKNALAIALMTLTTLVLRDAWPSSPEPALWLAASGVLGISVGDTALFGALKRLGAQVTAASQCLAPPVSTLLALVFLHEDLTGRETAGLVVTVVAVSLVILFGGGAPPHLSERPRRMLVHGALLALLSALCQGVGMVMARRAFQEVALVPGTLLRVVPAVLVLYGATTLAGRRPALGPLLADRRRLGFLAVAAFSGTFLGLLLMSASSKYTKAGIAAALTSTYPVWIIPIARFWLKEPGTRVGALMTAAAVGGIVLMVW